MSCLLRQVEDSSKPELQWSRVIDVARAKERRADLAGETDPRVKWQIAKDSTMATVMQWYSSNL